MSTAYCAWCATPFERRQHAEKFCADLCRKFSDRHRFRDKERHRRKLPMTDEQREAHLTKRRARDAARRRRNGQTPLRDGDPFERKIAKQWRCSILQARAWIEAGSFPP